MPDPFFQVEVIDALLPGVLTPADTADRRTIQQAQRGFAEKILPKSVTEFLRTSRGPLRTLIESAVVTQEPKMGFFDTLIKGVVSVGRGILGLPAAAPAAIRTGQVSTTAARRIALAGAGAGGAVGIGVGLSTAGGGGPMIGGVGGNGLTFTRTIVQSVNKETGVVVREEVLRGSPHLMNRDLAVAKRVFRLAGKLHRRMPKRAVRMSRQKMLTQQVVENALERASCPPLPCPK